MTDQPRPENKNQPTGNTDWKIDMISAALIGSAAGVLTTCAFIPQVIHTLRTKDTSAISLGMYIIFVSGVALWLLYGILLKEIPLIAANLITLALSSIILVLKIRDSLAARRSPGGRIS
ncbi:MAG: SemiSWEET transporter [Porticoccaceae bacterium]